MDGRLPAIISVNRFVSSIFSCSILLLGNVRISMVYTRRGPYPATALQVGTVLFRGAQQPPRAHPLPRSLLFLGRKPRAGLWVVVALGGSRDMGFCMPNLYFVCKKWQNWGFWWWGRAGLSPVGWRGIQLMGVVVMECHLRVPLCGCPLVWVSPGLGVPWHGCPLVWVPLGVGAHHFFGAVGCSLLPKAP